MFRKSNYSLIGNNTKCITSRIYLVLCNMLLISLASCTTDNDSKNMLGIGHDQSEKEKMVDHINNNDDQKDKVEIEVNVEGKSYKLKVTISATVEDIAQEAKKVSNKEVTGLYYQSSDEFGFMNNEDKLSKYKIKEGDKFEAVSNDDDTKRSVNMVETNDPDIDLAKHKGKKIPVNSFHVSCRSYRPKKYIGNENLGGLVLYSYDDKFEWKLNKVKCKTGYIIIKRIEDIKHLNSPYGKIHGDVYKSVFGVEPDKKIVGSGFSFHDGEWKYNSKLFNSMKDTFHDKDKTMTDLEKQYVEKAIKQWIENKQQNLVVDQDLQILEYDNVWGM